MYYIDSAEIEGFWGDRKLVLNFHQDVNFIIGVNGSGKTTLVNLLVAALSADFSELQRIEFTRLSIKLQAPGQRKCPLVLITKSPRERTIFSSIKYEIKESSRAKSIVVPLDEYQDQMRRMGYPRHLRERELYRQQEFIAIEPLRRLVNTSWLSVHRFNIAHVEEHSRERYLSTVDKKLEELANRLVRYFSALGKSGSEIIESFQKEVFLAMLHLEKEKEFFSAVKNINIDSEKIALEGIFKQFRIEPKVFRSRLDRHFNLLKKAQEKLSDVSSSKALTTPEVSALISTERIDHIVDQWTTALEEQQKIFEPRDTFLSIINSMMQRKRFTINPRNELQVTTQSGKNLELSNLSSGEKQLLIVLGEALLQEKKEWIYFADEPELSLHVRWQESLVENLRAINPNSQILFATHSPDVVSIFSEKVFDMESLLK